ncbi:MAG: desulfoferrodoxin family protein [Candidatus Saccharicenans sp.]|nr:desulfoferrodoxin family protein [Candidatus Saccharicenans sp.]
MKTARILASGLLLCFLALPLLANKSAVKVEAPAAVKAGEEATIVIHVSHRGNSSLHYTNRLVVMANGKEIARWNFTSGNRPENEIFSREVKLKIEEETEIIAEATCNLHGSAGPASAKIKIE